VAQTVNLCRGWRYCETFGRLLRLEEVTLPVDHQQV
jgi:hypothetical protein